MKSKTPSFVLSLKLNTSKRQNRVLDHRFYCGQQIYNTLVCHVRKQLKKMRNDKDYQKLIAEYVSLKGESKSLKQQKAKLGKQLSAIRLAYGLSEYQLHGYVVLQQHRYKRDIDSNTAQKIATAVWRATEKVLFGNGKQVHFKKYDDFCSMEGKTNVTGIRYKDGKCYWNSLVISVQHNKKDKYQQMALQHSRIKYCRIKRRIMGTCYHYYLELIMEGIPPLKHTVGVENIGIDIGTSTVAVVTDTECMLDTLGCNVADTTKQKRLLQRKMDRSLRNTNPCNYNTDGTPKQHVKWNRSKSYKKLQRRLKTICRKRAESLKQNHESVANRILEHGTTVRVETMLFTGLKKRKKETNRNKKGKYTSKKRYGKSIQNAAPGMLLRIIDRKLHYYNKELIHINTVTFKASQYNHVTDEYVKKRLADRYTVIENDRIQRDLYSAFLIKNSNDNNETVNRDKCINTYETFKRLHDNCIKQLIYEAAVCNKTYPTSIGLKHFM